MNTTAELAIRTVLAIVVVAAIVVLAWADKVTGGEAIAAISALVGGVLHATGVATAGARIETRTSEKAQPPAVAP
jgi:hypothetical protein